MILNIILLTLLVGSLITYIIGEKFARRVAVLFSIVSFVLSVVAVCQFTKGIDLSYAKQWISNPNIMFALKADGLSLLMLLLNTFLTPIIILTTVNKRYKNANILYSLVLFMSFAMAGTFLSGDGFLYYIFWELSLIPIFFIALFWGNDEWEIRKKAILKFFVYTFAGSLFMLVAFIYLYTKVGTFMLENLTKVTLSEVEQTWIFLAFFLAYAIKLPIFPFHSWQANTYEKSPAIGTMLLSGVMLKMGLYSILRWQLPITENANSTVKSVVIVLCVIGVVYASLIALKEIHIKRIFAYSSMAHIGLIAAAAYTYNAIGYQGTVVQMLAHGIGVVGLFFLAEIMYDRYQTYDITKMGGIRPQAIKFTSYFMIMMFASIGLPGTFNFVGEFTLLLSLSKYSTPLTILGGTTIILGAYYMLKMFQKSVLGDTNSKPFADLNINEQALLFILALVTIFFGIYPKPILNLLELTIN